MNISKIAKTFIALFSMMLVAVIFCIAVSADSTPVVIEETEGTGRFAVLHANGEQVFCCEFPDIPPVTHSADKRYPSFIP